MSLTFVDAAAAVGEPAYERAHGGERQYSIGSVWRAASTEHSDDGIADLQSAAGHGMRLQRIDSFNVAIVPPGDDQDDDTMLDGPQVRRRWWHLSRPAPPHCHQRTSPPGPHIIRLNRRMSRAQQELLIDFQLKQPNDNEALLQKIRARLDR